MIPARDAPREHLQQHNQEHVLAWWDQLTDDERCVLLGQVQALDLPALRKLYEWREHNYVGLPAEEVLFFQQGTMPALDLATGKLLLEDRGRLFLSPDGHGGTLTALADSGLLDALKGRGVRHVFYFQVDNPLVKIADPVFLGHHLAQRSEASSKGTANSG